MLLNRRNGAPRVYCTAGTTTNGCTRGLDASGVPSVAATSGFTVNVYATEGQKQGRFFYGLSGRKE